MDGLKTIEHFKCYIEELVGQLGLIKQQQEAERKDLVELRDTLKGSMTGYSREVSDQCQRQSFGCQTVTGVLTHRGRCERLLSGTL